MTDIDSLTTYYKYRIKKLQGTIDELQLDLMKSTASCAYLELRVNELEEENNRLALELDGLESAHIKPIKRKHREDYD